MPFPESPALYYWPLQLLGSLLWGLGFFGLGVFLGRLVWTRHRDEVLALTEQNERLRQACLEAMPPAR